MNFRGTTAGCIHVLAFVAIWNPRSKHVDVKAMISFMKRFSNGHSMSLSGYVHDSRCIDRCSKPFRLSNTCTTTFKHVSQQIHRTKRTAHCNTSCRHNCRRKYSRKEIRERTIGTRGTDGHAACGPCGNHRSTASNHCGNLCNRR